MKRAYAISILCIALGFLPMGQAFAASITVTSGSPLVGGVLNDGAFPSPQGDYRAFSNPANMALGATLFVSGTIAGFAPIHAPAFLTDGNYGNGRSWIDSGASPWFTVDLGSPQWIDTLAFGRDRLSGFDDRDPGQFQILVSDNNAAFTQILNSGDFGFSGLISGPQTVQASFDPVLTRYVRVQLQNAGAAIDEVEITRVPVPGPLLLIGALLPLWRLRRSRF